MFFLFAGIRTVNADGHASDAPGRLGDRSRVHVRDAEAAADDHVGLGQEAHTDVPQLAGPADHERAADGGDGLRGNRADV